METISGWVQQNEDRWVRRDGAVVKFDINTPYSNPAVPSSRMWTAWEPDPSERYIGQRCGRRGRFTRPRRFSTPQAAMRCVDMEFPL